MKWFKNNGLSIVFVILFLFSITGQLFTGLKQYNEEMKIHGRQQVNLVKYFSTGHFIEATFENFESEFLQMAAFIFFSMFFYQKGSSESKDPDKKEEVDKEPNQKKKDAPWPVKKGGIILSLYKHSLTYLFTVLFLLSFLAHWYGSLKNYNTKQILDSMPTETAIQYLSNSKLWFESFQNWQSEFMSVFAIVLLSIWFRQHGSAQSKPVDASYNQTGD